MRGRNGKEEEHGYDLYREVVENRSRSPELSPSPADLLSSWEEDRKLVLRGWSLTFIFLATLLVFSMVDG